MQKGNERHQRYPASHRHNTVNERNQELEGRRVAVWVRDKVLGSGLDVRIGLVSGTMICDGVLGSGPARSPTRVGLGWIRFWDWV